jgi:hypothetical protein
MLFETVLATPLALLHKANLARIIPTPCISKTITLPLLVLEATGLQYYRVRTPGAGHPRNCHPEAWVKSKDCQT